MHLPHSLIRLAGGVLLTLATINTQGQTPAVREKLLDGVRRTANAEMCRS
jgi:hypothetical protein